MEKLEMNLLRELLVKNFPKRTEDQIKRMYEQLINEPGAEEAYVQKGMCVGVICKDGRHCYYVID